MAIRRPPSRKFLERIAGGEPELIRTLEALFQQALDLTPTEVTALDALISDNTAGISTNTADIVTVNTRIDDLVIDDLSDVDAAAPALGMILIYDATAGAWEANTITAGSNIAITNADGEITVATAGASGTFTAQSGETITVSNGIITSIV